MSRFFKFGKLHVTKGNGDKLLDILLTASKKLKRSLAPTGNLYPLSIQIPTKRSGPLVGKCPKCGNNIVLKKSFYGCSNYPECKFTLAEHFRKKKLTKTNVKELLEGKETLVKGIKNKEKKPYNAVVKIGEKGYIDFISFSK